MSELFNITDYPIKNILSILLMDKSTKKNIIWATDEYSAQGYLDRHQMTENALVGMSSMTLQPRILKSLEEQQQRTRKKAEVFTPAWICNKMNNHCDAEWFGREDVFNRECGNTWDVTDDKILFPERKTWKQYVDCRRLEITCGEAPFLVSRYDMSTGELIIPPFRRIGILDRKLRIVGENTETEEEWLKWSLRAFQACYGYEYQGDSLLIARVNLVLTFVDYYKERWKKDPDIKTLKKLANIIAWNLWQMDGLKDTVPLGKPFEEHHQITIFEYLEPEKEHDKEIAVPCRIFDWRSNRSLMYKDLKEIIMGKKLFSFVTGNPPYNEDFNNSGENGNYAKPVYNDFMDAANKVANKVELIHPARFLFNAGSTPKAWNKKMLNDEHFKVLHYEEDATKIFPNTDIKGGVAITYHDNDTYFGAIQVFTKFSELNSILHKVQNTEGFNGMNEIVVSRTAYRLTDMMHQDHPEAKYKEDTQGNNIGCLSKGHDYDMATNIFQRLPQVFYDECPEDQNKYIRILGRDGNNRVLKWIRKDYVNNPKPLMKYSIVLPKANNTGRFGEALSQPVITAPGIGSTETFLSVGFFDTEIEDNNCLKYISSKFARTMLGILKTTQDLTPEKWTYVPLQDFTPRSDIDWSKSIHEIDLQLYKKYDLSKEEIDFIETNVKEMI